MSPLGQVTPQLQHDLYQAEKTVYKKGQRRLYLDLVPVVFSTEDGGRSTRDLCWTADNKRVSSTRSVKLEQAQRQGIVIEYAINGTEDAMLLTQLMAMVWKRS